DQEASPLPIPAPIVSDRVGLAVDDEDDGLAQFLLVDETHDRADAVELAGGPTGVTTACAVQPRGGAQIVAERSDGVDRPDRSTTRRSAVRSRDPYGGRVRPGLACWYGCCSAVGTSRGRPGRSPGTPRGQRHRPRRAGVVPGIAG